MLETVAAAIFYRSLSTGRTKPILMGCEHPRGADVDVIAKLSEGCERGVSALISEALSALLAKDLGLPTCEPVLVEISSAFVEALPDPQLRDFFARSSRTAFGSVKLDTGYQTWPVGIRPSTALLPVAAEIFAFDALIQNSDRLPTNPNCLRNGDRIAIYDHELAFAHKLLLKWKPPWESGSMEHLRGPTGHLFGAALKGSAPNFARLRTAWMGVTDARLAQYKGSLPRDWDAGWQHAEDAIDLIRGIRNNIDLCISEIERALG